MKDHEGYLSKGWMMHEPYCLHNGTPALAIYTYLYRTTRKNEWQGSLQNLADLVEIPLRTIYTNLKHLQTRDLLSIKQISHGHYSIKALRLNKAEAESDICGKTSDICGEVSCISGKTSDICGKPIKYNINIKENIKESRRSIEEGGDAPAAPAAHEMVLDRKLYIARVLSRSLPEYPYAVVYEYASLVQIPSEVVDDFLTHYASTGWKMNNGGRVENWAAALMNWYKRAKRFAERDAARASGARMMVGYQAGQQMSPQNRAIYEADQERKRKERERRIQESEEALSYEEYEELKKRLNS